jgi:hypothetical protein
MKHLFIALSAKGYGETILGIRVARELQSRGDSCFFLIYESGMSLLVDTPFQHMKISEHATALLKIAMLVLFEKIKPDSLILSDYFTAALAFDRAGIDPAILKRFGIPIGAIDTWDLQRSGTAIDVFGGERRHFKDWIGLLDYRLIPVPIARPDGNPDGPYYCCLPEPMELSQKIRRHIRRDFGIGENERAILFCTSNWQHSLFSNENANRLAQFLPSLLGIYLNELGPRIHFIHVGPFAYPSRVAARYHWLPPLPPDRFNMLLGSVDLLVTANASSTTIAKALVSGVPSVVLMNSRSLSSLDELRQQTGSDVPAGIAGWLRDAAPIFPFSMWPLGYYEFLKPLLSKNEYCEVVPLLEILEQDSTLDSVNALVFDSPRRRLHIDRQLEYVKGLRRLPKASHLVPNLMLQ